MKKFGKLCSKHLIGLVTVSKLVFQDFYSISSWKNRYSTWKNKSCITFVNIWNKCIHHVIHCLHLFTVHTKSKSTIQREATLILVAMNRQLQAASLDQKQKKVQLRSIFKNVDSAEDYKKSSVCQYKREDYYSKISLGVLMVSV